VVDGGTEAVKRKIIDIKGGKLGSGRSDWLRRQRYLTLKAQGSLQSTPMKHNEYAMPQLPRAW